MATTGSFKHPLDPLSYSEVAVAISVVKEEVRRQNADHVSALRFCETVLIEPLKEGYSPDGTDLKSTLNSLRKARVVTYNKATNETYLAVVEISPYLSGKILSWEVLPDVQPPMDGREYVECEETLRVYPPFIEAMNKRGIFDMSLVMIDPWCVGYFSEKDHPRRRLSKPIIFTRTENSNCSLDNGYARPVEGIYVLVDMQTMEVIEFEDREFVPLPPPDPLRNYTKGSDRGGKDRDDIKPLVIVQPQGPSFKVDGFHVEWQKWSFRVGFTPKEGLVLHLVECEGRKIAHRLSFCEMVVPYGDPQEPHYRKNAFDAGEDGLGKNAHALKLGCDCVGEVRYFDATLSNFLGGVEVIENAICLHEEDAGVLWKHMEWRTGHTEVRRSRRLSISFFCTVANYEYGFFWHFFQDGKIEGEVKLTGILSVGALRDGESARKYGTVIADRLYAPIHQHFFVARLDMDVDGAPHNQVVEVNVVTESAGSHNPHSNSFYAQETVLSRESEAGRDCNAATARFWKVQNLTRFGRTGAPVGYKLVPGSNSLPFARPEAFFLRRAHFLKHNLWVTPFCPGEDFPGGDFPNQSPRVGEGVGGLEKGDRNVRDQDVVLWYVFGLTHVVRPEDWPVMPVEHLGFVLQPDGFFDCSPAIDIPPEAEICREKRAITQALAKL